MKKRHNPKSKNNFLIDILFWLHCPLVIIWFGLFFIPGSLWQNKIVFHFWFISIFLLGQLAWGGILYPKINKIMLICPLTTLMQYFRGYPIKDKRNYNHSFIAELLNRLNINVSFHWVSILLIITLIIVSIQYFLIN